MATLSFPVNPIDLGAAPNDGTGDPLRTGGTKINSRLDNAEAHLLTHGARSYTLGVAINAYQPISFQGGVGVLADASLGRECHGFHVSASAGGGATGLYVSEGTLRGLTGLAPGAAYYIGTLGTLVVSPTTGIPGYFVQFIGVARSANDIDLQIRPAIYV